MGKRIASMIVENFLSIGRAAFDFDECGFVLVEGANGSGKSAIVDALLWCLFGETLRGYKHDDVVNRRVGEGCVVKVHVVDGDDLYTVTRARRHPKLKNSLTVTRDNFGEDMTKSGEKETQLVVEKVLGCTFKTFLSSVVFGQDRAYRFSSLTDAEQKKILDEVLGVERFADACKAARKRVDSLQAEIDANRRALEKTEAARDEAEAEAIDLQVKDTDFAAEQRAKVEVEREALAKARRWVRQNAGVDVAEAKRNVEIARDRAAACDKALATANEALAKAGAKVEVAEGRVADLRARLAEHEVDPGKCPTCGQEVKKRHAQLGIADLRRQLGEQERTLEAANAALDGLDEAVTHAKAALAKAKGDERAAEAARNEAVGAEANLKVWKQRAADCERRIAELEAEASPYAALAEKARSRHARHAADADQLADHIGRQEEQLGHAQFWVKAFGNSGLRSLLVDSSLPLLNEEAARVSRVLTGGAISIEFSATTEQKSGKVVDRFEVRVDNKHGAGDYAGNSAGERAKVDLCVGLALQRLVASRSSASFNLAVFDEVFDHLDAASHEPVVEVLSELDKDTVLVISHDDDLKAWFPTTWQMVKRGGLSSVDS